MSHLVLQSALRHQQAAPWTDAASVATARAAVKKTLIIATAELCTCVTYDGLFCQISSCFVFHPDEPPHLRHRAQVPDPDFQLRQQLR